MLISKNELRELVPHGGTMCLLDGVEHWDDMSVVCHSRSHRSADHPLLKAGRLAAVHGLEYGTQAMAVHAGLLARRRGVQPPPGYLAVLRHVRLQVERLDDIGTPLTVEARKLLHSESGFLYEFRISAAGRELVSAEASVMTRLARDAESS